MTSQDVASPDPVCPECGLSPTRPVKTLADLRGAVGQIQKSLREQSARERDYAVGYGWSATAVCAARVAAAPDLVRVVVAVVPRQVPEETGIIAAGRDADGDCYVLGDYSRAVTPGECMYVIMDAQGKHRADAVVGVANLAGDYLGRLWCEASGRISDGREDLPAFKPVTVMWGIVQRLRMVRPLYEPGMVHHVGAFPDLEDRMFEWMPGDRKPTARIEALAVALTELTF